MIPTTSITIKTTRGSCPVLAHVFGAWAVHEAWNASISTPRHWTITHVASGKCIPPFYTEDLSKAMALKVAKAIDEKFGNVKPSRKIGKEIVETIWRVSLGGKP